MVLSHCVAQEGTPAIQCIKYKTLDLSHLNGIEPSVTLIIPVLILLIFQPSEYNTTFPYKMQR